MRFRCRAHSISNVRCDGTKAVYPIHTGARCTRSGTETCAKETLTRVLLSQGAEKAAWQLHPGAELTGKRGCLPCFVGIPFRRDISHCQIFTKSSGRLYWITLGIGRRSIYGTVVLRSLYSYCITGTSTYIFFYMLVTQSHFEVFGVHHCAFDLGVLE
jgi:hypothetical protein